MRSFRNASWNAFVGQERGKTSGDIAQLLGLSEHTVNHHLLSAGRKLGASNRTHSVIRAVRRGILSI
ncbi:response regulator transcription factor [Pararhizobium sp. PWRC1-1]|uniref:response regulator transcription factor n=1 Tax=Pararhizobium sp. PWRC1-1 TaxID=2804566 RepID=UPI003CEEBACB